VHRGRPIELGALDGGPVPTTAVGGGRPTWPYLVVPGYTPRFGWRDGLPSKAIERLERALAALHAGLGAAVIVSGGTVHSDENEAVLMRQWLLDRGVEPARIVVEPCARHTTTNLRNAGRILLQRGVNEALVVTSDAPDWRFRRHGWRLAEQSYYLGFPWLSSFHVRCIAELGYRVGELDWLEPHHVRFRPSGAVFRESWKETFAGDP
jgi:uncharacterized SAM-binding protein YcdF (DUF218 family)